MLEAELQGAKFSQQISHKNGMLNFLYKFRNLNIFGFNSSRYDLKCLAPYIYKFCEQQKLTPNIVKVCMGPSSIYDFLLERNKVFDTIYQASKCTNYIQRYSHVLVAM